MKFPQDTRYRDYESLVHKTENKVVKPGEV